MLPRHRNPRTKLYVVTTQKTVRIYVAVRNLQEFFLFVLSQFDLLLYVHQLKLLLWLLVEHRYRLGCRLEGPGFNYWQGQGNFIFTETSISTLGSIQFLF